MNADRQGKRPTARMRERMTVLSVATVVLYAGFIQYVWGWQTFYRQWSQIGILPAIGALSLLVATYFLRCYRIHDYFPKETAGRFLPLLRVTQVHNLLNIMLPLRAGEISFPLLMRSEFSVPLGASTSAMIVMRLLDLHALFAAVGFGVVASRQASLAGWSAWTLFFVCPLVLFFTQHPVLRFARRLAPTRMTGFLADMQDGLPRSVPGFLRAWAMTVANWTVKVLVLAWILSMMGVSPIAASFGGALGGELSSVLPVHAPAGVGTYPAGITAGAISLGASAKGAEFALLIGASVNAHVMIIVSAVAGTLLSILLSSLLSGARGSAY